MRFIPFSSGFAACVVGLLLVSSLRSAPLEAVDADGRHMTLNAKGTLTAVISSSPDTQDRTRAAGQVLDLYRGRSDFRLIIVVDLRDSLAGIAPDFVKSQIRHNLDDEAKRLTPFYRKNGNGGNPRADLSAIPDFDGKLIDALQWKPDDDLLRITLFGKDGKPIRTWDDLQKPALLADAVAKALGGTPAATATDKK